MVRCHQDMAATVSTQAMVICRQATIRDTLKFRPGINLQEVAMWLLRWCMLAGMARTTMRCRHTRSSRCRHQGMVWAAKGSLLILRVEVIRVGYMVREEVLALVVAAQEAEKEVANSSISNRNRPAK